MRVHCAGCGNTHNISANLAVALLESAQRGEMHTVGRERQLGQMVTQIYPRCLLKMRHEFERSGGARTDVPASTLES